MRFRHKNSLVRHQCQHTGERRHQCPKCDSAFIARHRLSEHMKKVHNQEEDKEEEDKTVQQRQSSQEVQIICEKPEVKSKRVAQKPLPQQISPQPSPQVIQLPLVSAATIPVMSVVAGTDGRMYLLPSQQQQQQQPLTILTNGATGSTTSWILNQEQQQQQQLTIATPSPTFPCVAAAISPQVQQQQQQPFLSPKTTALLSTTPAAALAQAAQAQVKIPPQQHETDFLDLAVAAAVKTASLPSKAPSAGFDFDGGFDGAVGAAAPPPPSDIVASALVASRVLSEDLE